MANDILPFCGTDTGTNLLSQSDYTASTDRTSGQKPGIASAKLNNKALRQAAFVASQFGQFVSNNTGTDVLDDNNVTRMLTQIESALARYAPVLTKYLTGAGTHNVSYYFRIASGSATVGATYTNNSVTFTVAATVASATVVRMTGPGAPTATGTLTKASGTGDATLSFYSVRAPLTIEVLMIGGGGGGSAGGSASTGTLAGGNTTFGTTLLVANGGGGGILNDNGGTGGTASLGTGPLGIANSGANGGGGMAVGGTSTNNKPGGEGAPSPFGGGGTSNPQNTPAIAPPANLGSGGHGGWAASAGQVTGSGGGAGGYVSALINTGLLSSYAYSVGGAGTGGTGGTNNGSDGSSGFIQVIERFQ